MKHLILFREPDHRSDVTTPLGEEQIRHIAPKIVEAVDGGTFTVLSIHGGFLGSQVSAWLAGGIREHPKAAKVIRQDCLQMAEEPEGWDQLLTLVCMHKTSDTLILVTSREVAEKFPFHFMKTLSGVNPEPHSISLIEPGEAVCIDIELGQRTKLVQEVHTLPLFYGLPKSSHA